MTTRKIFWIIATLAVLSTFLSWIPVDIYENSEMFFHFAGGILFAACLFFLMGDYGSVYELIEDMTSKDKDRPQPGLRRYAPIAILPGFFFLGFLIFHQGDRVEDELKANGVLAKGRISGGRSTTTSRRFQSNTTYDINIVYEDSLKHRHDVSSSVNGSEFNDLYEGAIIDIVYSRKHPGLAKPVLGLDALSKYKKIAREDITLEHLTAILDQKVKPDSVLPYLNSICYEWKRGDSEQLYSNEHRNMAIKLFPDGGELAYIVKTNLYAVNDDNLESTFEKYGFKKKARDNNGEQSILYYNDTHAITIETKKSDQPFNSNNLSLAMEGFRVYHIARITSAID